MRISAVVGASLGLFGCLSGCLSGGGPPGSVAGDASAQRDAGTDAGGRDAALLDAAGPDAQLVDAAPPADAWTTDLPEIHFDRYHSQEEIAGYLRAVADARPDQVEFVVLGSSAQGREIAYVMIDATGLAEPPAIFLNGTHHGDEQSSTETVLALIDFFLRNPTHLDAAKILQRYAVYALPLVNPDGHAAGQRGDYLGRDPNRDYSFPGRSDADSFAQVETQAIKQLQDEVGFRGALAYHSGIEEIVWPWGFSPDPTDDADWFATLAQAGCTSMEFQRCLQAYFDYPTQGEYVDYAYWKQGTLALTVEVSVSKTPPAGQLQAVVDRAIVGTVAVGVALAEIDSGARALVPAPLQRTPSGPSPWSGGYKLE